MCLLLVAQKAQAQYAYGISAIDYDDQTHTVYGYSATEVDYYAGYYYDPYVEGFMYDQYNSWPIASGSSRGYEYLIDAEVYTYKYGALPNTEYDVISDHYVIAYWSTSVVVCDEYYYSNCTQDYWYDPWGYGFFGGGNFGSPYWWWGNYYGGYVPERTFYLGTTGVGIITPPDSCPLNTSAKAANPYDSMTAEASSNTCQEDFTVVIKDKLHDLELLENGNKSALLDADVLLEAKITPSSTTGAYLWTITGDKQVTSGSTTSSTIGLRWTKEGNYTVQIDFTRSDGTKKSAHLNVKVIVPALDTFTATELTPQVNAAGICFDTTRPSVTLGCGTSHQNSGIQFAAKAKSATFLLSNGGSIKYVQLGSSYSKRELKPENGGTIQCRTKRTGAGTGNVETGWMLDKGDPYATGGPYGGLQAIAAIDNSTGVANIGANDTPSETILTVKDYFTNEAYETYVVYFTGDDPAQPRTQRVIGKMAWNWQAHATFNAASGTHLLDASASIPTAQKTVTGTAITEVKNSVAEVRPYQGKLQDMTWTSCGTTTPPNAPPRAAGFGSQSVPTVMEAGQVYNVLVTMNNNGSATWTIADGYKLGSQNPQDNGTWGTGRVYLPDGVAVSPGSGHTFNFNVTAPSTPGTYNFQWRMVQEGVEWFGDYTPNILIDVVSTSSCDPWAEQNCYDRMGDWDSGSCQCFNVCNNWKCMGDYPYTY